MTTHRTAISSVWQRLRERFRQYLVTRVRGLTPRLNRDNQPASTRRSWRQRIMVLTNSTSHSIHLSANQAWARCNPRYKIRDSHASMLACARTQRSPTGSGGPVHPTAVPVRSGDLQHKWRYVIRVQTRKDGSAIALLINEIRGAGKLTNVAPVLTLKEKSAYGAIRSAHEQSANFKFAPRLL
jgi:hypothetical protein